MLYLSRIISIPEGVPLKSLDLSGDDIKTGVTIGSADQDEAYGVVDTDDDSETFITWNELTHITDDMHIEIVGFAKYKSGEIRHAIPYQDPRYCSKQQAKTKTLLGVDIHVWRNEVTAIIIDKAVTVEDVRIRLSDFGSKVSDSLYLDWSIIGETPRRVIIELDDKIKLYGDPTNILFSDAIWDITDCSDDVFAQIMHDAVYDFERDESLLIDNRKREN